MSEFSRRVLMLYTGGTIGMIKKEDGAYKPFSLNNLLPYLPELNSFPCQIDAVSFDDPIDSSDMSLDHWQRIARRIERDYYNYDAFLILHGSDTMAYTSAALSFMLENISKPIILTGSQLPMGIPRSDARENILTSLEIALAINEEGGPLVPEVAVYFEYDLYRGNRLQKISSEDFEAFHSPNYPLLAQAGVTIKFNRPFIAKAHTGQFKIATTLVAEVAIVHCFPGMSRDLIVPMFLNPKNKAVIIRSFGSGNGPSLDWFLTAIKETIQNGVPVINVSQCPAGEVQQSKYEAGRQYQELGVLSGGDMVLEAALLKAMFLLGQGYVGQNFSEAFLENLRGELS
jgi:L-asparaginase